MPEIGATLREARMRARIDISEIEAETKIRAKYLRALENEEWGLLPGPAYVRSFLRTYAEALGLDAKLLLEEYKLRYEQPSDHDLMPIGGPRRRGPQGRRRQPRVPRGIFVVLGLLVALLVALYVLGKSSGSHDKTSSSTPRRSSTETTPARTTTPSTRTTSTAHRNQAAGARLVRLQIIPTGPGPVFVCARDAGGRLRIPGVSLREGAATGTYRSRAFKIRLGNGNATIRANGRSYQVADASPVGYSVSRKAVRRINVSDTPSCVR